MSRTQVRKKGFSFLSFFLGFLFAIIVLVGTVAGVVIFALNTDLDTLFSTFGVDNSKDEEGNNKIVNTDPENGGVKNVLELLTAVSALASDYDNKTIGDIEALLPIAGGLVDTVYEMVNQYVSVDKAEIKAVKFSEFGEYLKDVVYDIQPASFFDPSGNALVEALLCGVNAEYVEVLGTKYPVWYDDNDVYFYDAGEGNYYVVENSEGAYTATTTAYTYNEETAHCTGNFYYANADESGEKITVSPITIGTFIEGGDFLEPLNKIKITEFFGGEDDGLVAKILGDVSVGDLIGGEFNFDEKINTLKISDIMEVEGNGILEAIKDSTIADLPDTVNDLKIGQLIENTDGNKLLEAISEYKLSELPERINDLQIGQLIENTDGNKLLDAISEFKLSELSQKINDLQIGQLIDNKDNNKLLDAISKYTISELPSKIGDLTIGDLVGDTGDNKLLDALKDSKITELDSAVENLCINDLYAERDDDGNLVGIWKQLLCTRGEDGSYTENRYTLNQFGELVNNITQNMRDATLYELDDAGILTFEDKDTLDKVIEGKALGTYSITGALEKLTAYIP